MSFKKIIPIYLVNIICAFILSISYVLFVFPNNFAPSGVGGIGTMLQYKLGFNIGYFSLAVNIPLCLISFFFIDRRFALRSFVFSLFYSAFFLLFSYIDISSLAYYSGGTDTVFPCVIAGVFSGFSYGICFRVGSSTGGMDIIAKGIGKRHPRLNFFFVIFILNSLVAIASLFVYRGEGYSYKPVVLCLAEGAVSGFVGNRIIQGYEKAYKFTIVTLHSDEISKEILEKLSHSATRLDGRGIYSDGGRQVLMCVVGKHQLMDFKAILKNYPDTFAIIETVNETLGNFSKDAGKKAYIFGKKS